MEAQGEGGVIRRASSSRPGQHRRSFSLDHSRVRLFTWSFYCDQFGFTQCHLKSSKIARNVIVTLLRSRIRPFHEQTFVIFIK